MKFKLGPAKTRSNYEAFIYEVSDKIYGKYKIWDHQAVWGAFQWTIDGECIGNSNLDLLPNNQPEKKKAYAYREMAGSSIIWSLDPLEHEKTIIPEYKRCPEFDLEGK